MRMGARAFAVLLLLAHAAAVRAQSFDFRAPASPEDAAAAAQMKDLATRIIPVYQDEDRPRYLANLSALQLVAGDSSAAYAARLSLRELTHPGAPQAREAIIDLYARTLALSQQGTAFAAAAQRSIGDLLAPLDDGAAYALSGWLQEAPAGARDALLEWLARHRETRSVDLPDALEGVRRWLLYSALKSLAPALPAALAEDEQRRYLIETVPLAKGRGALQMLTLRPRSAAAPPPVLVELARPDATRATALYFGAHGYATVLVPTTRAADGRRDPWSEARATLLHAVQWTARQSWHDGRIALIGSGLGGYAAWSLAGGALPKLAAVALAAPEWPGVSTPAPGGIFENAAYERLVGLVAPAQVRHLDATWYARGAAYRRLDRLAGRPSPLFQNWLEHPTRDEYWRRYEPDRESLARLTAPLLVLSGPFEPGQGAALQMRAAHIAASPAADDTLLLLQGAARLPEDPDGASAGTSLRNSEAREWLRQWLDAVLGRAQRSPALATGVHAQIGDGWQELASAAGRLRLFLQPGPAGACRLVTRPPPHAAALRQSLDLADRRPGSETSQPQTRAAKLPSVNGLVCSTDPLAQDWHLAGEVSAELVLRSSQLDFDLQVGLYERTPEQEYLALFDPPARQRMSLAGDPTRRTLFAPGEAVQLRLPLERVVARTLRAGSRLVLVLSPLKRADLQINYGTGTEVSDETLRDADTLRIEYLPGTRIELPRRP